MADAREITRSARTFDRSAMISSVNPSANNALSGDDRKHEAGLRPLSDGVRPRHRGHHAGLASIAPVGGRRRSEHKRTRTLRPGFLWGCGLVAGARYLKLMVELAVPPSGEVIRSVFGGEHQKPVPLLPVLVGLTVPALVTLVSYVQLPRGSTRAVPITGLVAAVIAVQTPLTL